jgi:hypothetical protein
VTPPLFQWSVPLVVGAICMLAAPLWMLGTPAVEDASLASGWQLGLYVFLYYPSAVVMLFIVGWMHRFVTRKPGKPRIERLYLTGANICLALALLVMLVAVIEILT